MHHLHVHTIYSAGDALGTSEEYAKRTNGALAITDHDTMSGYIDHHDACHKHDVKPIYGVEVTLSNGRHLTLLAMNKEGYHNLCRMMHLEKTQEVLSKYSGGIICLSGDLNGPLSVPILRQNRGKLKKWFGFLKNTYGDRLYLEKIDHGLEEQKYVNHHLEKLPAKTVFTNDVHYPDRSDARAHAVFLADKLDKYVDLEWSLYHGVDGAYLCDMPDQEVSDEIVNRCTFELPVDEIDPILPDFSPPENYKVYVDKPEDPQKKYLLNLGIRCLIERVDDRKKLKEEYLPRLKREWKIVCEMGYAGYYLIVYDFIKYAHQSDIPVGPGRGSGAGSLLAYALRITDIDPIKRGLLFERFLNPERVSMPDFDIDFAYRKRDEVIQYVKDKYGGSSVSAICTYGTCKPKEAWKTAARPLGVSRELQDDFSDLYLPETKEGKSFDDIDLEEALEEHPGAEDAIRMAGELEGAIRSVGRHAAGFVITPKDVEEYAPLSPEDRAVQYDMEAAERMGLVKFDFLGLKELDVIDYTQELVGEDVDMPHGDKETMEYISTGNTLGMFQISSEGFQDMMPKMKPEEFKDLVASVALYRPGPKDAGMVDEYIKRKNGEKEIEYPHPDLKDCLEETYGVIVYQEQVMQIAQIIAGYSLGEADILRRAMGKKKTKVMNQQKPKFISQAQERGYSEELAHDLWSQIDTFSDYGFNKSHAASYAQLTWETAYLKTHYRPQLLAAQMDIRHGDAETVSDFIREAERENIPVYEPDVQHSDYRFTVHDDGSIRVGLCAIKNLNDEVARNIEKHSPFEDLPDLIMSVDMSKGDLQSLLYSGSLDALMGAEDLEERCYLRAALDDQMSDMLDAADGYDEDKQPELFSFKEVGISFDPTRGEEWGPIELAEKEYDYLERYRTFHPAEKLKEGINTTDLDNWKEGFCPRSVDQLTVCGVIRAVNDFETKNGEMMGFVLLEDETGEADITVFPDQWDPELFTERSVMCYTVMRDEYEGNPTLNFKRVCKKSPQEQTASQTNAFHDFT